MKQIKFTSHTGRYEELNDCIELVRIHWSYGTSYTIIYNSCGERKIRVLLSTAKIHYVSPDVKISDEKGIE